MEARMLLTVSVQVSLCVHSQLCMCAYRSRLVEMRTTMGLVPCGFWWSTQFIGKHLYTHWAILLAFSRFRFVVVLFCSLKRARSWGVVHTDLDFTVLPPQPPSFCATGVYQQACFPKCLNGTGCDNAGWKRWCPLKLLSANLCRLTFKPLAPTVKHLPFCQPHGTPLTKGLFKKIIC